MPRVLLLQEDQATGGVNTMARLLGEALLQEGWPVAARALKQKRWRELLAAARASDVLLASHNFRPAYVAWLLGLLLGKPVVVWVHGPLQEVLAQARASWLKQAWLRFFYRRITRLVFVSNACRASFLAFMGGPLPDRQHGPVIPNAVSPAFAPQPAPPAPPQAPQPWELACIGRLSPEKQPLLLLEMLRLLPHNYRLTFVGDGPLRAELLAAGADLLDCNRLSLAGARAHDGTLYRPWQVTLLASRYEGCPLAVLESFASGVPCVATPTAAAREMMGTQAAFMLAQDSSARALADAVLEVTARPPEATQAAMAQVLARYRWQDFVRRWQDVLREAARPC